MLLLLAFLVCTAGNLSYLRDTLRGRVQPNRVSWGLWALIPALPMAAQLTHGLYGPALITFAFGAGPLMVFASSFLNPKVYWQTTPKDYLCGSLSLLGLILWLLTQNPLYALFFSIAADAMATLPTLLKAWRSPHTETYPTYLCSAAAGALGLFAAPSPVSLLGVGFSLYVLLAMGLITLLILIPRRPSPAPRRQC